MRPGRAALNPVLLGGKSKQTAAPSRWASAGLPEAAGDKLGPSAGAGQGRRWNPVSVQPSSPEFSSPHWISAEQRRLFASQQIVSACVTATQRPRVRKVCHTFLSQPGRVSSEWEIGPLWCHLYVPTSCQMLFAQSLNRTEVVQSSKSAICDVTKGTSMVQRPPLR